MRKRRRLADKLTIMVCAVLVAVSAFFYAPMDVEAEEISASVELNPVELSLNEFSQLNIPVVETGVGNLYSGMVYFKTSSYDLIDRSLDMDAFYAVSVSGSVVSNASEPIYLRNSALSYSFNGETPPFLFYNTNPSSGTGNSQPAVFNFSTVIYGYGRDLVGKASHFNSRTLGFNSSATNFTFDFNINVDSVVKLTGEESVSYQQGYNAGYSAGEQVGESNGYSNGYSDGYEAGEQNGYDSGYDAGVQDGFQSGQGSVDTQSYYDAGYNAGYDVGYLEGYDEGYNLGYDEGYLAGEAVGYEKGYESGWQAFKDKISGWGADTSDYPLYISSSTSQSGFLSGYVYGNSQVYDEESIILNFDIDPNHIYRFDVKLGFPLQTSYSNVYGSYTAVYFCAGGVDYFISPTVNFGEGLYKSIYVRGDMLSSSFSKKGVVNVVTSSVTNPDLPASFSFTGFWHDVQVYDVGPIGNMQNHIANQTDQLTGGYNDSQGNSVNNEFSSGLNEFETAEDSLFATATTGLKDFTFFDIQSVPAMVTGMSFVGSIMSGWFTQAGGASGVGIVLSILFSIMLVAMVLGLYRWYQSKGGKD